MRRVVYALTFVAFAACSRERSDTTETSAATRPPATASAPASQQQREFEAPVGRIPTREEMEKQRFDSAWRRLRSFQIPGAPQQGQQQAAPQLKFVADPRFQEKLEGVQYGAVETLPLRVPIKGDVSGPSVLRAQVMLDRARFAVGAIDGRWGKNSEIALYWFQKQNGLPATGDVDQATFQALARAAGGPALRQYTITPTDAKGPFTRIPEDVYEQEKLDCLCFENMGELLAEKFHATVELLETLNPNIDFDKLDAGATLLVPNVRGEDSQLPKFAKIRISVEGSYLHGVDAGGRILFHAPTTLGSEYDPSPSETLKIVETAYNPHFHYQPKLFFEVPDDEPEAHLKPGPNSPVGVVWIALSKKHYGIHGTSSPDTIGYASSHGCVRLTNWDAHEVAHRAPEKILVEFVDTREGA